jgi:hypothetical protein
MALLRGRQIVLQRRAPGAVLHVGGQRSALGSHHGIERQLIFTCNGALSVTVMLPPSGTQPS